MKRYIALTLIAIVMACASRKEEGLVVSDQALVDMAKNSSSYIYFRNSADTLKTDPSSEHGFFMRVRFNPRAVSAMPDSIDALNSTTFPNESMIVKEMYSSKGGPLTGFVVMYKLTNSADNNSGWLWGEYRTDGTPIYSVAKKGDRCVGCHTEQSNSDLVRTFSLH